jgi:Rieske Fe-S protein
MGMGTPMGSWHVRNSRDDAQPPRRRNAEHIMDRDNHQHTDQGTRPPQEAEAPATESVEQYMRIHDYIERLREDKRPSPPGALAPEKVRAYQMAALLRSAAVDATAPDPVFVARLRSRIQHELAAMASTPPASNPLAGAEPQRPMRSNRAHGSVSRRALLGTGLGAAAAGLAAGAALGRSTEPALSGLQPSGALVPAGAGIWVAVAAVHDVPLGGIKHFATEAIVGYVRHTPSGFAALSGVCTHMGCLLQWNGAARTYDCPCHGGRFSEDGSPAPSSPVWYRPLAPIATRVQGSTVEVYLPPTADPSGEHLGATPAATGSDTGYQVGH